MLWATRIKMSYAPSFADNTQLLFREIPEERYFLCAVFTYPDLIDRSEIVPEDLSLVVYQQIYQTIIDLREAGQPISIGTVLDLAQRRGRGRVTKASLLIVNDPSAIVHNIGHCIQVVKDESKKRAYYRLGIELQDLVNSDYESVEELDRRAREKFDSIGSSTKTGLISLADGLIQAHETMDERSISGGALPGIPCGLRDLDAMTQGFQRSDLIVVAGRPSMGKTSFMLRCILNAAHQTGKPCVIFSLEMSVQQLIFAMISIVAKIEAPRLRAGYIAAHEWELIGNAIATLARLPIYISDDIQTVSQIRGELATAKGRYGDLGLVAVDYLQLLESKTGRNDNRVQEVTKISRELKQVARTIDVPVLALSQLSRGVESRTNKRPMMSDLRESGSIEQDCDLIVMLYREEYYDPATPDRGIAELIIVKHRTGPTGTVKVLFEPRFTRFLNLAQSEPPPAEATEYEHPDDYE
jgi:replicative DNA helicase